MKMFTVFGWIYISLERYVMLKVCMSGYKMLPRKPYYVSVLQFIRLINRLLIILLSVLCGGDDIVVCFNTGSDSGMEFH